MVGATASALFHTGTFPFLIGDTRASADFVSGYLPRETPDLSEYRFFSGKFTRRESLTEISGVWAYTPKIADAGFSPPHDSLALSYWGQPPVQGNLFPAAK
jgi:hypothetical protein